jgi:hypothetical protein
MDGNLCRCTGYRPILKGFSALTQESTGGCCGGADGAGCACRAAGAEGSTSSTSSDSSPSSPPNTGKPSAGAYGVSHATQETIFPPALILKVSKSLPSLSSSKRGLIVRRHPRMWLSAIPQFKAHINGSPLCLISIQGNEKLESKVFKGERRVWYKYDTGRPSAVGKESPRAHGVLSAVFFHRFHSQARHAEGGHCAASGAQKCPHYCWQHGGMATQNVRPTVT